MGKEVELKLAMEPDGLERIKRSALVRASRCGRPKTAQLSSTYYDTPGLTLTKAGVTVRLRRDGGARLQTVKTQGSRTAGLFARAEWEQPLAGDSLDPAALRATGLDVLQDDAVLAALAPVFTTEVKRTLYRLGGADWEVELALDLGHVGTDAARQTICEAELEMKAGEPARLYALARQLTERVPARLLTLSKSDRGFALAAGAPEHPVKARPVHLAPGQSAADAFQAIARNCLEHLLANERPLLAHHDPEALHQMRVALRRLRSAIKVFGPLVAGPEGDARVEDMRWLLGHLGPARDADVFLAEILDPVVAANGALPGLAGLREHWRRRRDTDFAAAVAAVADPRFTRLLLDLGAWIEAGDWRSLGPHHDEKIERFARRVLAKLDRRMRKAAGKRLERLPPAELHHVRILGKRLRYAGEFFATLYPKGAAKPFLGPLATLQDRLGELNDIAVAGPRLAGGAGRQLAPASGAGDLAWAAGLVEGWHDARRPGLRAEAAMLWKRLRKMDRYWD